MPDAVFVTNHLMTIGALQAIAQAKLAIPADIAVVSFDDMPWSVLLQPPLTAMAQPAYDLGVESARLLLSRLEGRRHANGHALTHFARKRELIPQVSRCRPAPLRRPLREWPFLHLISGRWV